MDEEEDTVAYIEKPYGSFQESLFDYYRAEARKIHIPELQRSSLVNLIFAEQEDLLRCLVILRDKGKKGIAEAVEFAKSKFKMVTEAEEMKNHE